MSSLSHHYSWHKALISLKPLLDFLLPTSAYQQAGLSSFTTHKLGGDGDGDGENHRCLKDTNYETILLQKGTENEGNYTQVPKLPSLADSEEGCENSESLCSKSSPQAKQWKKLQRLNFTWPVS